ncbi:MAG: isoaspartyl peptidase/L-asparaginase [Nitrososphaeraceae archaeon]|jgi:isoaspartyl peptidase/L-asparaginase-like protein (Ntn-hydrolase superfamily)
MDGRDISAGSVGTAKAIENAVKIARQIMERTDHVMIVSDLISLSYLTILLKNILMM